MNLVMPLYISHLADENKTKRYIRMLFGCINSYLYNGNTDRLIVLTNSKRVNAEVYKYNNTNGYKDVEVMIEGDEFFTGFIDYKTEKYQLNILQSVIKLSIIESLLKDRFDEFVLLDVDMIFTSTIKFEELADGKCVRFYRNKEVYSDFNYKVSHMLGEKEELFKLFKDFDDIWLNSGVVVVNRELLPYLNKYKYIYDNPEHLKVSDELIFNVLYHNERQLFEISDNHYNTTAHVRFAESIVHFFSIKPYHIYIDEYKNLNMRLNTDDIFDHIDNEYFDLLTGEMSKHYNKNTIYNCLLWWYYYGDAAGKMDDPFEDFKHFDSNYIKHMLDKLF